MPKVVHGTAADDVIHVAGDGTVVQPGFNDMPFASAGFDVIFGHAGADVIEAGAGEDYLDGGEGNDTLAGGADADFADGGDGRDTLEGDDGNDQLVGGADADSLRGGSGKDLLDGGDGNDLLDGGAGADTLIGGAGIDTVSYVSTPDADGFGVTVSIGGQSRFNDAEGDIVGTDIENIQGSGSGDRLFGSAADNVLAGFDGADGLFGGDGNDTLSGGGDNDTLVGGAGADRLFGGDVDGDEGIDTADYRGSAGAVTVDLATGTGSGADAHGDTLSGIENLIGSAFGDSLAGSDIANVLNGLAGNDQLAGQAGDDTLIGGTGADSLFGGTGIDTAAYDDSLAGVTASLATRSGSGNAAEGDTYVSIENLTGSLGADRLTGDNGANVLRGVGGNDILNGGFGADTLDGGAGTDLVSYFGATAGVTVNLLKGVGLNGDAQGDSYVSIENVNGSKAGDTLFGTAGANVLNGFEGNDLIAGLAGQDTLTGGIGADRFVFTAVADSVVGANADRITDFSRAQGDKIDLSGIDASTVAAGNQAFSFIGTALYHHVAGELRFAVTGGTTTIAGDVNGDGASDFHIVLTGTVALTAGDFAL